MKLRVLTNSERSTFACKKRWAFAYLDGLTTVDSAAPLRQGSLGHSCLQAWYESGCTLSVSEVEQAIIEPWIEQRIEWACENLDEAAESRIEEDREIAALTIGIFRGYVERYADDLEKYEVLSVEGQIGREIIGTNGKPLQDSILLPSGKRQRRKWIFGGACDAVLRDRATGLIWLLEHKNTIEINLEKYCVKLDWDPQIRGYAWAMEAPHSSATIKEPLKIAGVIYNVMRKKLPMTPKLLKKGGTSKAACDTTREHFLQTLLERGEDPDDFADRLTALQGREFFHREHYPISDAEKEKFAIELGHQAQDVKAASKKNAYHTRKFSECTGPMAMRCVFRDICLEDNLDEDSLHGFRIKSIRHQELTGELAEPMAQERGITLGSQEEKSIKQKQEEKINALAKKLQTQTQTNDVKDEFENI